MLPIAIKTKFSHVGARGARINARTMCEGKPRTLSLALPYELRTEERHPWAARRLAEKIGHGNRKIVTAQIKGDEWMHIVTDDIDPAQQWTIEVLVYYPANSAAQFKARAMRPGFDVREIEGGGSGDYGAHAMCKRLADVGLIPKYDGYYNSLVIRETVQAKCTITEVDRKRDFRF